jgi:hypothetical protein
METEDQWYASASGRAQLSAELAEIERHQLPGVQLILPDGRLAFRFPVNRIEDCDHTSLCIITKGDHPTSYPDIVLQIEDQVITPTAVGCVEAFRLFKTVERCRALDRYQRALNMTPLPLAAYYIDFKNVRDFAPRHERAHGCWYETTAGKHRLADELTALRNAQLPHASRVTEAGELMLLLSGGPFHQEQNITVVFPQNYPYQKATVSSGPNLVQSSESIDVNVAPYLETAPLIVEVLAVLVGQQL